MYSHKLQGTFNINYSQFGIYEERKAYKWLWVLSLICLLQTSVLKYCTFLSNMINGYHCWVQPSTCVPYVIFVSCVAQIFYIFSNFHARSEETVLLVVLRTFIVHLWYAIGSYTLSKTCHPDIFPIFFVACKWDDFFWFQMRTCLI